MAKKFAMIFGWLFVIIGILGFFGNPIVSDAPGALFHADTAHNIVHLLFGAILLWVVYGMAEKSAVTLRILGIVYLIMAVLGFLGDGSVLGLVEVNTADNWLHVVLAAFLLWGSMARGSASSPIGQI
jgi:hypothetical protein